ncbi:MAG: hypothetical protein H0X65_04805 [Gemmatimonadetes bacterium]|nr:hypothetical protein [Gemmatimonadota bacterium]
MTLLCFPRAGFTQTLHDAERWSTKGSRNVAEFVYIVGMAEAGDGGIQVSDGRLNMLIGLSASGVPLRIAARRGNGPGEVRGPTLLTGTPSGGLAVYDIGQNAIQIWNRDMQFEQWVRLEAMVVNPKGFVVLPTGHFVLSGGISRNPSAIHRFHSDGRLDASWYTAPRTEDPRVGLMIAGGPLAVTADGRLLFSLAAPHRILAYPVRGGEAKLIAGDPKLLAAIADDFMREEGRGSTRRATFQWHFPQSRAVLPPSERRILNVVLYMERGTSLWEVYSPDGKLLSRKEVSRAYHPWAITSNGDVLASYRDPDTDEHIAVRLALSLR